MKRYILTPVLMALLLLSSINYVYAAVSWDEVFYSSGQYAGGQKVSWDDMNEEQKAFYLERYAGEINYCLSNYGKMAKDIDSKMQCCAGIGDSPVSYFRIGLKYANYGDYKQAAYYYHKDWLESIKNPNWRMYEDPLYATILAYEQVGMYTEALQFYERAYQEMIKDFTAEDIKLLKTDFTAFKQEFPDFADRYTPFMADWEKAKKLAKIAKPKSLAPAVKNHEWFFSDKPEEVLKALQYYNDNKVKFMVEKAAKDKRPVVAKKAKEYLDNWDVAPAAEKQPDQPSGNKSEAQLATDKK